MKSRFWLIYVVLYLTYNVWALLYSSELNVSPTFNIFNAFELIMLISIIGLSLQIKLINIFIWQKLFWVSIIYLLLVWVAAPISYIYNDIGWKSIIIIQIFSIPTLPLFIGLFIYALRSPEIWNKTPNKAIKKDN